MKVKKVRTTATDLKIDTTTQLVVEIDEIRFELDERFPWITIQHKDSEMYLNIDEIDGDFVTAINTLEDLKIVAMNWYFNNTEIAKEIESIIVE